MRKTKGGATEVNDTMNEITAFSPFGGRLVLEEVKGAQERANVPENSIETKAGDDRSMYVYVPASGCPDAKQTQVVMFLRDGADEASAQAAMKEYGLDALAEKEHFVLAFPNPRQSGWSERDAEDMDYLSRCFVSFGIRNDDLRWVLSDGQYRRFMGADYFYRPIYVTGGRWSLRVYINYPNRGLFYFGVPYHYHTYCGAHYRPHIHHTSYYRGRYNNFHHYSTPHRVRDQRVYHSYRRSDFGSVRIRPNSSVRPHNAPTRPGNSYPPHSRNFAHQCRR